MSGPKLKPCPFCGGVARLWPVIMPFDADCDVITVQCTDCDVAGPEVLVDQDVHCQSDLPALEADAIAAWNTRHRSAAEAASKAREAALRWENAELVGALEAIQRWRDDCKSYDEECGHPDRLFCEDVGLIEAYAERILDRVQARAALTKEPDA